MLVTEFVAKKFCVLDSIEKDAKGTEIEEKIQKMIDIEKQILNQFLIMCATVIRDEYKDLPKNMGAEIFDMFDCKIIVEKKQNNIVNLGNEI